MFVSQKGKTITVLVVSVAVSAVAAVVVSAVLLGKAIERMELSVDNRASSLLSITNVKPPSVPGSYGEAMGAVREKTEGISLLVYNAYAKEKDGFAVSKYVGTATTLTSDGWLLFHKDTFEEYGDAARVVYEGKVFPVLEWVADPDYDFVFGKTDINGAKVGTANISNGFASGDVLFVVSGDSVVSRAVLYPSYSRIKTAVFDLNEERQTMLLDISANSAPGAAVVDASGAIVGIVTDGGEEVLPYANVDWSLKKALAHEEIKRRQIGLSVVDLWRVVSDVGSAGWLVKIAKPGSVARTAGIEEGDIIVSINGKTDFYAEEIVRRFSAGEKLDFLIDREGTKMEISVKLDEV